MRIKISPLGNLVTQGNSTLYYNINKEKLILCFTQCPQLQNQEVAL